MNTEPESDTPRTLACYTRAGMMLADQVDELDRECRLLERENAELRKALEVIMGQLADVGGYPRIEAMHGSELDAAYLQAEAVLAGKGEQ